ncbi:hypothetical protein IWW37_000216 [Coemansia sp. RSA 2050]|nr:hypothetical protein IWW37_000216 [Coemansia sp. RSA 2050]
MANTTWEPERFSNLDKLLKESLELTDDSSLFDRLAKQLEKVKPDLAALFEYPGKNAQHRDELSKGTPKINGEKFNVNEEFIAAAKKLSDFLELDEDLAATVVQLSVPFEKRFEMPAVESAVALFFMEREAKLNCIVKVLDGGANQAVDKSVRNALEKFVGDLLPTTLKSSNKMFPARVLATMSELKTKQDKIAALLSGPAADLPFRQEVVTYVQTKLGDERKLLAMIIFGIIRDYQLISSEIISVVEWLRSSDIEDPVTLYMSVALLTALSSSAEGSSQEMAEMKALDKISHLVRDSQLLVKFNAEIIDKPWSDDGLKGLIWLQWALLVLFGLKRSPGFDSLIGFREDRVDRIAEQAVQMGAYRFAVDYLLGYRITDALEYELSAEFLVLRRQATKPTDIMRYPHFTDVPVDFQAYVERTLEDTLSAFIDRMSSLIRRMKYIEDDAITQARVAEQQRAAQEEKRQLLLQQQQQQQLLLQSGGYRYSRPIANKPVPAAAEAAVEVPRRDTEALFLFIAILYTNRPDAGLRFWGRPGESRVELDDRMAVFLRWASDSRDKGMICGFINMLSALACGPQASICAYEFLCASEDRMMSPSRALVASNKVPVCSWSAFFAAVSFYVSLMRQSEPADPLADAPEIPDEEVAIMRAFLRLCRTVVRYSIVARTSIYDSAEYNAVPSMFALLGCVVPVPLKANLMDTIAAFGELDPGALFVSDEGDGVKLMVHEMARRIWGLLELSQTLPTTNDMDALRQTWSVGLERVSHLVDRTPQRGMSIGRGSGNRLLLSRGGIVYELDEIEAAAETYPQMRAFVRLIASLIHVSDSAPALSNMDRDPILYSAPSPSIPMELGESYRVPGIGPYISFVLDSVLLKADQRSYQYSSEKWSVYAASLDVIERSLGTMDLSGLTDSGSGQRPGGTGTGTGTALAGSLRALVTHPGFEIAIRVLCGSKLLDALLNILNVDVDEVNAATGEVGGCIIQSVLSTLRILLRILKIQDVLLRTAIPLVMESSDVLGFPLNLPRSLTTLEQLLLSRRESVVRIITYVECVVSPDVCLASIKILHILSDTAVFNGVDDRAARGSGMLTLNRLVGIIDSSAESMRICHGFINCLGVEDDDAVPESLETALIPEAARGFTSGLDDQQATAPAQSIRLAIIDLLLANLSPAKPAPTIAHYLLGFSLTKPASDDLPDPSQRTTCLHMILGLLHRDRESAGEASSLMGSRPRLAERCYHLIYHLCSDPVTGDVTTRYLRGREDFFYSQITSTPSLIVPEWNTSDALTMSLYSPIRVYAQMHARSWLWRSTALELHTLVLQDSRSRAKLIGEWLVGDAEQADGRGGPVLGGRSVLDSRMRLLSLFDSLRQAYRDSSYALKEQRIRAENEYLGSGDSMMDMDDSDDTASFVQSRASLDTEMLNVDPKSCIVTNERGCAVYDLHALVALLRQSERDLDQSGQMGSVVNRQHVHMVVRRAVIRSYFANQESELHYAYGSALRGWKELAEILVSSAWSKIDDTQSRVGRERTAFQLLKGLACVLSENDPVFARGASSGWWIEPPTSEQEARHAELLTAMAPTLAMFAERLSQEWACASALPRVSSLATSKPGTAGQARAMAPALDSQLPVEPVLDAWRMLVNAALTPAATVSLQLRGNVYAAMLHVLGGMRKLGESSSSAGQKSRLVSGALDILSDSAALGDRLLESVSADAADASDAWKTVAFSLLNALASLFAVESRPNRVVMFLARKNYFASFVGSMLRREDLAIQATLQPEPASLNALYIYEAKMSFFLQIAQRSDGAERLLENGIIDVLADCAFLDLRPQGGQGGHFADAFIPARAERFHLLLMPALNLMLALVAKIGRDNLTLWMKAARFVSQHHAVLEAVLKEVAVPANTLSIALLTQARAVTTLVFFVARQRAVLDREAAMAGSGHVGVASLHLPILALLPKLSTSTSWAKRLLPTNDVECALMAVPASSAGGDLGDSTTADVLHTLFGQQAGEIVDSIVQSAIAYVQAVTERSFRPAFSWSIEHSREADYTPSLATLVALVRRSLARIEWARKARDEKLRLAKNPSEMSTADMRKLIDDSPHEGVAADLSAQQMRALASVLLEQQGHTIARSVSSMVAAVEQALVLLWRHLSFFINTESNELQAGRGSLAMPSQQERDMLRADAYIELPPLLTLLADLKLTQDEFAAAPTHMSFIQMLVRRIKDLVSRDVAM